MTENNIYEELNSIFNPRSMALIGASAKEGKVGRMFMDRFMEMKFETLYPVNPGADEVLGYKAYPSINEIPGPVDLALIVTPPKAVLGAIEECVAKGVKGIIINTAGFGEVGEAGKKIEAEMARIARSGGARIIGPNCIGIYCPASRLPYPLGPGAESGTIGVVSQSGSLADHLTLNGTRSGLGFSKAISCGNQCDLCAEDFLEYLGEDPKTEIIVSYLEGINDGRRFNKLIRKISKKKPVIIWKTGTSEAGARAAASHTGALAGTVAVWDGVLEGGGVIRVGSLEEIMDTVYAFYFQPLPKGDRVAIITGPGGPAVGATDACLEMGLQVPSLSDEIKEKLFKVLPPAGTSAENPIDLSLASIVVPNIYHDVIKILGQDDNIDMIVIIGSGGKQFHDSIATAAKDIDKPIAVSIIIMENVVEDSKHFTASKIPMYSDPKRAVRALANIAKYAAFRKKQQ